MSKRSHSLDKASRVLTSADHLFIHNYKISLLYIPIICRPIVMVERGFN